MFSVVYYVFVLIKGMTTNFVGRWPIEHLEYSFERYSSDHEVSMHLVIWKEENGAENHPG